LIITTWPGLLLHLRKKGVRCIGTIKKNRVHSDKKLLDKLEKNQIKFYSNSPDNSLLFILWEDRNTVRMMTNMYLTKTTTSKVTSGDKVTTQTKPDAALEYNKYAKGVDRCNELSTEYSYPHRSKKWWKPIFYHILQVCITNALIIFKEITKQKITHKEFIESIIVSLLGEPKKQKIKTKDKLHLPTYIDPKNKTQGRCKMEDCTGKPLWKCSTCSSRDKNVYLCIPECWGKFHKSL